MTAPVRVSPGIEERAAPCPRCGGPSKEFRVLLSLADAERKPWSAHKCSGCISAIEAEQATVLANREAEERAFQIAARRNNAIAALDVPPLYQGVTLDGFEMHGDPAARQCQARVLQLARRYVGSWPDVPSIVVFIGTPGTGKGHVAWSLAREVVENLDGTARVCVLSDVIRDLRDSWRQQDDGPTESERLRRYRGPDLLVIDEVSRHSFYGQPQQHLYDLIAWRELYKKPTIITTNESGDALADVLGPALSSRALAHDVPWQFGSADYRPRKRTRVA